MTVDPIAPSSPSLLLINVALPYQHSTFVCIGVCVLMMQRNEPHALESYDIFLNRQEVSQTLCGLAYTFARIAQKGKERSRCWRQKWQSVHVILVLERKWFIEDSLSLHPRD